ncbi:hypothetical protein ACFL5V_06185 [Fibrobacterota bacterium]
MMTYPKEILNTRNVDVLKAIAKELGLSKDLRRKKELISALGRLMNRRPEEYLEILDDLEMSFVTEMVHTKGRITPEEFMANHGGEFPLDSSWSYTSNTLLHLVLAVERYRQAYVMPKEVIEHLKPHVKKPEPAKINCVEDVPETYQPASYEHFNKDRPRKVHVFSGERNVFPELRRVLQEVGRGKTKLSPKSGFPTSATVKAMGNVLYIPEFQLEPDIDLHREIDGEGGPMRAFAWPVILQQCKWATARGGALALTRTGKTVLSSLDADAMKAGFNNLLTSDSFDELRRVNRIRGQSGRAKRYMTKPSARHRKITGSMKRWPVGKWIDIKEAFRFAYASGNGFDASTDSFYLYFEELQYGSLGNHANEINMQYLRVFLFEYMATLGMIDAAYVFPHMLWPEFDGCWGTDNDAFCGRYDGLLYVRLNTLGAYCLGNINQYAPPEQNSVKNLTMLDNFDIVYSGGAGPSSYDNMMLDRFAKRKNDYTWKLVEKNLLDFIDKGGTLDEVNGFLEQNSGTSVPAVFKKLFEGIGKKLKSLESPEEAVLINTRDDITAMLIANDTSAKKYCFRAGEKRLAVPHKHLGAFKTCLKKIGYVVPA